VVSEFENTLEFHVQRCEQREKMYSSSSSSSPSESRCNKTIKSGRGRDENGRGDDERVMKDLRYMSE
jgi:hypothetical protein